MRPITLKDNQRPESFKNFYRTFMTRTTKNVAYIKLSCKNLEKDLTVENVDIVKTSGTDISGLYSELKEISS